MKKKKSKQEKLQEKLVKEFKEHCRNNKGKMHVQQYLDALALGIEKGLNGQEYTWYAGDIFSAFLIDMHFKNICDVVYGTYYSDPTASINIFKKKMRQLQRKNKTPKTHHLFKQ